MKKKAIILVTLVFISLMASGCERPKPKATVAARIRIVEGHIKNIEYAIIQKAFEEGTGDLTVYDGTTSDILIRKSLSVSNDDYIYCSSLTIDNGTVIMASNCKDSTWDDTYSYVENDGAYRNN